MDKIEVKAPLPAAAVLIIAGVIVSAFTKVWLWSASLIGLGITTLLFSFKFNKAGFIALGVSCFFLGNALTFYSGWRLP